jgi:very-short-patch-repair endonuclease
MTRIAIPRHDSAQTAAALLRLLAPDVPPAEREYRCHPTRRWRFDLAWPAHRLALEIDGGQWAAGGGRHNQDGDREQRNQAACLEWRVLRYSPAMLDAPDRLVAAVRAALLVASEERG